MGLEERHKPALGALGVAAHGEAMERRTEIGRALATSFPWLVRIPGEQRRDHEETLLLPVARRLANPRDDVPVRLGRGRRRLPDAAPECRERAAVFPFREAD